MPSRERRAFLQQGLCGTAGAAVVAMLPQALLPLAARADAPPESTAIDAHVHVWTPDTRRYRLAPGFRPEQMQPASFTPEQLLGHARPQGVGRIVLIQMSFYGFDNAYMLDTIRRFPGVFSGVAVIDENDQPEQTMRQLGRQAVRGFRIRPDGRPADRWLAGDAMAAMWRCGAETGMAICPLIDPQFLPSVDAMCRRFRQTPVVIDHFARIGIDGHIRSSDLDNLCRLARYEKVAVKLSAFYALGNKQPPYTDLIPMIRRVLDAFGPERLMWASDAPFQVIPPHSYQASVELIRQRIDFLSESDRQWLLRKTAERVFFG